MHLLPGKIHATIAMPKMEATSCAKMYSAARRLLSLPVIHSANEIAELNCAPAPRQGYSEKDCIWVANNIQAPDIEENAKEIEMAWKPDTKAAAKEVVSLLQSDWYALPITQNIGV